MKWMKHKINLWFLVALGSIFLVGATATPLHVRSIETATGIIDCKSTNGSIDFAATNTSGRLWDLDFEVSTVWSDGRYLYKENTSPFTPDADYEPATKKYVDDNGGGGGTLDQAYDAGDTIDYSSNNGPVRFEFDGEEADLFTSAGPLNWYVTNLWTQSTDLALYEGVPYYENLIKQLYFTTIEANANNYDLAGASYEDPNNEINWYIDETGGAVFSSIDAGSISAEDITLSNPPRCRAYRSGDQLNLTDNTPIKVQLDAETYDSGNIFDSSTNYRCTPGVEGYYLVIGHVYFKAAGILDDKYVYAMIYENGALVAESTVTTSGSKAHSVEVQDIIYIDSDDYIELYAKHWNGDNNPDIRGGSAYTFLDVHKIS